MILYLVERMNYVCLDMHTDNIVYIVLSDDGNVKMRGKIGNDIEYIIKFLRNFKMEIYL